MGDTENGSWSASELSGWIRREETRMDRRERDSLDSHIAGNYGEDQVKNENPEAKAMDKQEIEKRRMDGEAICERCGTELGYCPNCKVEGAERYCRNCGYCEACGDVCA